MSDGQIQLLDEELQSPRQLGTSSSSTSSLLTMAARDITNPAMTGYLEKHRAGTVWFCCWCVLKGEILYIYDAPIDDVAMETIHLTGCDVIRIPSKTHPFAFEVTHPMRSTHVFSAETEDLLCSWVEKLSQQVSPGVTLEGLNLEEGRSREFDEPSPEEYYPTQEWERDLLRQRKCKLLAALLKQKKALERKQAQHSQAEDTVSIASVDDPVLPPPPEFAAGYEAERAMKEVLKLKQKKISMQLKVDCLQKQLNPTTSSSGKINKLQKKLKIPLNFGRDKKSDPVSSLQGPTAEQVSCLEAQLEAMKAELAQVNLRLEELQNAPLSRSTETVYSTYSFGNSPRGPIPLHLLDRPRSYSLGLERTLGKASSDSFSETGIVLSKFSSHNEPVVPSTGHHEIHQFQTQDGTTILVKPTIPDAPKFQTPSLRLNGGKQQNTASISRGVKLRTQYGITDCTDTPMRLRCSWSDMNTKKSRSEIDGHLVVGRTQSAGEMPNLRQGPRQLDYRGMDGPKTDLSDTDSLCNVEKTSSQRINPNALAQIAAFEELIQEKMNKS